MPIEELEYMILLIQIKLLLPQRIHKGLIPLVIVSSAAIHREFCAF